MIPARKHILDILQICETLHIDGHTSNDPVLYLQVVLIEQAANRALREMIEFKIKDKDNGTG